MAASDEWEEVLLPEWLGGWQLQTRFRESSRRAHVPADTVLTVRRHVYVGAIGATPKVTETESPRIADKAKITELLAQFGKPTFGV